MAGTTENRKKHRSPAYPSMDLQRAVGYVRAIYQHERKASAPVAVVAEHCGTDIKSSKGLRLISALKQFGLVVEEGSGDDRQVRLSELALDIELAPGTDSQERKEAIKKAAIKPPLHKTLWDAFKGELPSDGNLRSHLLRKLGFNDTYVGSFIKQFRKTLVYAGLAKADKISSEENDLEELEENDSMARPEGSRDKGGGFSTPLQPPDPPKGMRDFPLYTSGQRGALYVPASMTEGEFKLLKTQIENSLAVIEATAVRQEQ